MDACYLEGLWIGARLGLTTGTVSWYIDRLMRRFDVSSRCELVAFLYGAGILTGYPAQITRAV